MCVYANNERNSYPLIGVIGIVPRRVKLGLTITTVGSVWERGAIAFISPWWQKTRVNSGVVELRHVPLQRIMRPLDYYISLKQFDACTSKSIGGAPIPIHHATGIPRSTPGHCPTVVKGLSRLSKPCAWRGLFMASCWGQDLVLRLEPTNNWTKVNELIWWYDTLAV